MDAYVLGTHDRELPTHLLGEGEEGHRVRAMARLEGPHHNAFFAIEAPDAETVDLHVEKIKGLGANVNWWLIRCISDNCLGLIEVKPYMLVWPSHMPPFDIYEFHLLEQESALEEMTALYEILGPNGVAAATNGKGQILIEIGSNDPAAIAKAATVLGGNGHSVVGGFARGE